MHDSPTCVYTAGQPAPKGGEEIAKIVSELGCIGAVTICLRVPMGELQFLRAAGMSSGREVCDVRW